MLLLYLIFILFHTKTTNVKVFTFVPILSNCAALLSAAIRFGRMPQSEKLKLKAEMVTGEQDVEDPRLADQKTLARQIYEAYLKNFNMNKAKARTILTGKTSTPVC